MFIFKIVTKGPGKVSDQIQEKIKSEEFKNGIDNAFNDIPGQIKTLYLKNVKYSKSGKLKKFEFADEAEYLGPEGSVYKVDVNYDVQFDNSKKRTLLSTLFPKKNEGTLKTFKLRPKKTKDGDLVVSAKTSMNNITINRHPRSLEPNNYNFGKIVAHEIGHAFGNMFEKYWSSLRSLQNNNEVLGRDGKIRNKDNIQVNTEEQKNHLIKNAHKVSVEVK